MHRTRGNAGLWVLILVVVVVLIVVYATRGGETQAPLEDQTGAAAGGALAGEELMAPVVVTYTDAGYTPASVMVQAGGSVVFKNESSRESRPATAAHPTHKVYPGSDIAKCDTAEAATIFDACRGLAAGEEWTFTFSEIGTWKYHNHLRPADTGEIVVEAAPASGEPATSTESE